MRRWWDVGRAPSIVPASDRLEALCRLRAALSADEYRSLRRLTGGLRRLPFDADPDALDQMLIEAGDQDVELLVKCQAALSQSEPEADADGGDETGEADAGSGRQPRIALHFEPDAPALQPFLASLRRNGFRAVSIEREDGVSVFVEVEGTSDLEVVQAMALVTSLRDLVTRAEGHTLRGRQAGR